MTTFIDTSALYAVLCGNDPNHEDAQRKWITLLDQDEPLVSTNYVLVETIKLIQHRLGMRAVRDFQDDAVPLLQIIWVDDAQHQAAVTAFLMMGRRQLSLVDCSSFLTMRNLDIRTAFAYDPHFVEQDFVCL